MKLKCIVFLSLLLWSDLAIASAKTAPPGKDESDATTPKLSTISPGTSSIDVSSMPAIEITDKKKEGEGEKRTYKEKRYWEALQKLSLPSSEQKQSLRHLPEKTKLLVLEGVKKQGDIWKMTFFTISEFEYTYDESLTLGKLTRKHRIMIDENVGSSFGVGSIPDFESEYLAGAIDEYMLGTRVLHVSPFGDPETVRIIYHKFLTALSLVESYLFKVTLGLNPLLTYNHDVFQLGQTTAKRSNVLSTSAISLVFKKFGRVEIVKSKNDVLSEPLPKDLKSRLKESKPHIDGVNEGSGCKDCIIL